MPEETARPATQYLLRLSDGDRSAAEQLLPLVYEELRRQAAVYLRDERAGHTLQPTALVHEAFLKLVDQSRAQWKSRDHFCAVASQAMRRILVDHARRHRAAKRGGGNRVTLDTMDGHFEEEVDLIALDDALHRLSLLSERQGRIIELRFFGGMSVEEAAHVLDVSERTVKGDWRVARAWLQRELAPGESDGS